MTTIPIVFAFDNNLAMPAAVCIFSLLKNAAAETAYHIHVMHSGGEELNRQWIDRVMSEADSRHKISYIRVGNTFDDAFEIRSITTPAYYRLLIPELIPDYDKVLYSDVDVIFRSDLTRFFEVNLNGCYFGGVNSMAHFDAELTDYYTGKLKLDPHGIIYSGNLLINCKALRESPQLRTVMLETAKGKYRFQDMDVINITCGGHIKYMSPSFCLTNYICKAYVEKDPRLFSLWNGKELRRAMDEGIVHFNGRKPWQGYCVNFDIWWEYYRKSPVFDEKFYFDFFYDKLDELDRLPLKKRIKILLRYFVYGKK